MAVLPIPFPENLRVAGIRLGTARAGIRSGPGDDLAVIELAPGSQVAAVFTRNAFCAAPVRVAKEHLAYQPRWLLINAGNANAGTGAQGIEDARATCAALARLAGGQPQHVLPFSTGVIGEPLPVAKICAALPQALSSLRESGWESAARAILTTDTCPKGARLELFLAGRRVTIAGIAKGAGMIAPNLATMLAFIGTDAHVAAEDLQLALAHALEPSFNAISVDGDTSTNDACALMATGAAGGPQLTREHPDFPAFLDGLTQVCTRLAEAIVRDGEGATKLIRIRVEEAQDQDEARRVGMAVANSPLVKTAFFASDPNWGRILAAVGRAVEDLDIARVRIWLDEVCIVAAGGRAPEYREELGKAVMARPEIEVRIALGRGRSAIQVLSCDLSYEYVRINAAYRS
nr:bifunctional ornithine acetyltransferase / N-acetylglutamate synthase protein [uncultured Gammaproteobacteria bacterium]BAL55743.1 bifunctional ornithine acetyltransferase / N-acetylglutamate synthase protein [uncultured Gammaproteobacteria bacterium]